MALATILATTLPSFAQEVQPPKPYELNDARFVDLISLALNVSTPSISVGQPSAGGLSYSATYVTGADTWRHSTFGGIYRRQTSSRPIEQPYQWYEVSAPGMSANFRDNGFGTVELVPGSGSGTLVISGNILAYTARDGSIYTFDRSKKTYSPYRANQGLLTQIQRPNGEIIDYTYASHGSSGLAFRLQSITNNLGYQLHFDYVSDTGGNFGWSKVTKVTAFNMVIDACAPNAATCSFSQAWPSLTFSASGSTRSATDTLGRTLRVVLDQSGNVGSVARPSTSSGQNLSYSYVSSTYGTRVRQVSDEVGTWTYSKTEPHNPSDAYYYTTTTITDPLSRSSAYAFEWIDPFADGEIQPLRVNRLTSITDALNQTTAVFQDAVGLHSVVNLEGDVTNYAYNNGNPAGTTHKSKPGSGLPSISVTATFGDCSTPIRCARPTSVTDARGGVTDYTYDAAGNLLRETGPAPVPGAPRPQTRYTWERRYAWYKQDASGAITQAPSPVWVQTGSSLCMTGATC